MCHQQVEFLGFNETSVINNYDMDCHQNLYRHSCPHFGDSPTFYIEPAAGQNLNFSNTLVLDKTPDN